MPQNTYIGKENSYNYNSLQRAEFGTEVEFRRQLQWLTICEVCRNISHSSWKRVANNFKENLGGNKILIRRQVNWPASKQIQKGFKYTCKLGSIQIDGFGRNNVSETEATANNSRWFAELKPRFPSTLNIEQLSLRWLQWLPICKFASYHGEWGYLCLVVLIIIANPKPFQTSRQEPF